MLPVKYELRSYGDKINGPVAELVLEQMTFRSGESP